MIKKLTPTTLLTIIFPPGLICLSMLSTSVRASDYSHVEKIFTQIYQTNVWASPETVSGPGSEIRITKKIVHGLSKIIKEFKITSIADAPCGDFNWMRFVDFGTCHYTGLDIVKELIDRNILIYEKPSRTFKHINLIEDPIDTVDLILCRDMLAHLSYTQIFEVLDNFKRSGSKYLLVTTNTRVNQNSDIAAGDWRLLNLEKPPFNFPKPLTMIEEDVPFELERGKHLGLWRLDDIKTN